MFCKTQKEQKLYIIKIEEQNEMLNKIEVPILIICKFDNLSI